MGEHYISLGENLKRIRKELSLRQHEITGGEITRNLISLIENNRTPLHERNARLIAMNINNVFKERYKDIYIDPEDIMNPERYEAKKQADICIEHLEEYVQKKQYNIDEGYIKEIEDFLSNWDIPEKKVRIYELLGDMCYYNKDYECEYLYLTRALENYFIKPIKEDIYILVIKLISSCIVTSKFHEAKRLTNLKSINLDKAPNKYKVIFYYNKSLAYEKLGLYDDALRIIEVSKMYISSENKEAFESSLILEGICYDKKGLKDKAISKFKDVLVVLEDDYEKIGLTYINIIDLYMSMDSREKVMEYINKLILVTSQIPSDNVYLSRIYYCLSRAYEYLGIYDSAEDYYIKALNESKDKKETNRCIEIANSFLSFCISTNQHNKIVTYNELFTDILTMSKLDSRTELILKLIMIKLEHKELDEAKHFIKKVLEWRDVDEN